VTLSGVPASPGSAIGKVKIVGKNTRLDTFPPGAVLAAHTTDPTLIGFMLRASAIVTEIGSRLCHTAIVALEMGIPCVVAVDSLLESLSDGTLVRVDGSSGEVSLLGPSDAN
jgi:pyruvate,water dikinase